MRPVPISGWWGGVIRKPTFLKLHRWIGLGVGLFLIVQALTGTSLVFRDEIERVIHPGLIVAEHGARLPVQSLVDAFHAAHPEAELTRAELSDRSDQAVQLRWTAKGARGVTAIDPFTARIVGDGLANSWPMEWIFNLHENLHTGPVGQTLIGAEGLGLLFMALTGLFYWWPGARRLRQGFRVKLDGSADLRWRTLHRAVGAGAALLLLVSATTGVLMVWKDSLRNALATVTKTEQRPAPKVAKRAGMAFLPVDRLVAEAKAHYGDTPLRQLRFSSGGRVVAVYLTGARTIRPDGTSQAFYNAYDGSELGHYVAGTLPASNEFIDWIYTVHTGQWGGMLTRLILVLTGLVLAGMAASGLWLWYARTARRRAQVRSPSRVAVAGQ
jgi:uncharacterized iron-regulated membrane protein